MRRERNAKIVATLGPATSSHEMIAALSRAGADVFRLNFSHGTHDDHKRRLDTIREVEKDIGRPIGVMLDLQGPKLRIGRFAEGRAELVEGSTFRMDLDDTPGDNRRVMLPHPEIFDVVEAGMQILVNDGKVRLRIAEKAPDSFDTVVLTGGELSANKGVNVPGVVLPISPLTPKDREDLAFGLDLGVDWVALSFVQRPADVKELRALVGTNASILCKIEKPAAVDCLPDIVALTDAIMVARGDLGVEMPPQEVPSIQKRIIRVCRQTGKPVIVATQMLESMIQEPTPTRAEASDVATAVYEGADAVMLSGETAVGAFPIEAVAIMDRILNSTEADDQYRKIIDASRNTTHSSPDVSDAICASLRWSANILSVAVTVTYTNRGATSLRAARERPMCPILGLTPFIETARRLALVWGVHPIVTENYHSADAMVENACRTAVHHGYAEHDDLVAITCGMPLGYASSTNMLRIAVV